MSPPGSWAIRKSLIHSDCWFRFRAGPNNPRLAWLPPRCGCPACARGCRDQGGAFHRDCGRRGRVEAEQYQHQRRGLGSQGRGPGQRGRGRARARGGAQDSGAGPGALPGGAAGAGRGAPPLPAACGDPRDRRGEVPGERGTKAGARAPGRQSTAMSRGLQLLLLSCGRACGRRRPRPPPRSCFSRLLTQLSPSCSRLAPAARR